MNLILFGAGRDLLNYLPFIYNKNDVKAILDNDESKCGLIVNGIEIMSANRIYNLEFDKILITSRTGYKAITRQLLEMEIPKDKIVPPHMIGVALSCNYKAKDIIYLQSKHTEVQNRKNVFLFSTIIDYCGATIALYNMAIFFKSKGYNVIFISAEKGNMISEILSNGIDVIIDPNIVNVSLQQLYYENKIDIAVVNTLQLGKLLINTGNINRIIWWIHEPQSFYTDERIEYTEYISYEKFHLFFVSQYARKNFETYCSKVKADILPYYVNDIFPYVDSHNEKIISDDNKIRFVFPGGINSLKRTDCFVRAVNSIDDRIVNKAEFVVVGFESSDCNAKQENSKNRVRFLGGMKHDQALEILNDADVVVSCSREESLATTCVEAMMLSKPFIAMFENGIADFVDNMKEAIILNDFSDYALERAIEWCINNKNKLIDMGKKGRICYENNFTKDKFYENMNKILYYN